MSVNSSKVKLDTQMRSYPYKKDPNNSNSYDRNSCLN